MKAVALLSFLTVTVLLVIVLLLRDISDAKVETVLVDWRKLTIENFSPGVSSAELKARLGPPTELRNFPPTIDDTPPPETVKETVWLRKEGREQVAITYRRDPGATHLTCNRIMLNGKVIALGWEKYYSVSHQINDGHFMRSDIVALLGEGEEFRDFTGLRGLVYAKPPGRSSRTDGYRLVVNFPFRADPQNPEVLNFEFAW